MLVEIVKAKVSERDECCPRRDVSNAADRHVDFKSLPDHVERTAPRFTGLCVIGRGIVICSQ